MCKLDIDFDALKAVNNQFCFHIDCLWLTHHGPTHWLIIGTMPALHSIIDLIYGESKDMSIIGQACVLVLIFLNGLLIIGKVRLYTFSL